jgi:DNA-binding CsgD family transcriptional regulator
MHGGAYDARALATLLRLLERGVVTSDDASEVAAHLAAVTGSDAVAFGQNTIFAGWSMQRGLPQRWIDEHDRFRHQDPIEPRLVAADPGTWHFVDRLSAPAKETDLHERFQSHFGDGALVRLYSPFASDLFLVLYRDRKRTFDADDQLLLELLTPHLARGLATRRALSALAETKSDPNLAYATISFPSGKVSWSASAREIWQRRLAIGTRGWSRLDRMLHLACQRFERGTIEARSQILIPGVRADFAVVPPEGQEQRRVVGFLIEEATTRAREAKPAEALLTDRQRAVAHLLLDGHALTEVARELDISLETARGYRREIYERLGVHNRAELAATLG